MAYQLPFNIFIFSLIPIAQVAITVGGIIIAVASLDNAPKFKNPFIELSDSENVVEYSQKEQKTYPNYIIFQIVEN